MKTLNARKFVGAGTIAATTERGFGFIKWARSQKDLFFHSNELINIAFDDLRAGDSVGFDIVNGVNGLKAVNVGRNGLPTNHDPEDAIDTEERLAPEEKTEVRIAILDFSRKLAEIIARNPDALESLEWRDVERLIALAFSALGFAVELTPGSKDGGKDVILSYTVSNKTIFYIVEIKHWRDKVGSKVVRDFLHVVAREERSGGLLLATHGFANQAIESLTEFERATVRFGTKDKIVCLCRNYIRAREGVWYPPQKLDEVIVEETR